MNCEFCGEFSEDGRLDKRFCSKKCGKNAARARRRLERHPDIRTEIECKWCKKVMFKTFAHNTFCSNACRTKYSGKQSNYAKWGGEIEEFFSRVEATNGCCEICGKKEGRSLHFDHDHTTGATRGVLCSRCNQGLGYFKDSVENLSAAIRYLSE